MKLSKIIIALDPSIKSRDLSRFDYDARSIGYALGLIVSRKKIDFGYRQLIIAATNSLEYSTEAFGTQSFMVRVPVDFSRYRDVKKNEGKLEYDEYFSGIFKKGIDHIKSRFPDVCIAALEAMKHIDKVGSVTKWTSKKIGIDGVGVLSVECELNASYFIARLCLTAKNKDKQDAIVGEIIKTNPDELHFHHLLGDLVVDGDLVKHYSKYGKLNFSHKLSWADSSLK